MRWQYISTALAALFLLAGCDGKDETVPDYFPNEAGDVWIYAGYDSIRKASYELRVEAKDEELITLDGYSITMRQWLYTDAGVQSEVYILEKPDLIGLVFVEDSVTFRVDTLYMLPLIEGDSWTSQGRVTKVEQKDTLYTPAGMFTNARRVVRRSNAAGTCGPDVYWFVPNVGTVKETHKCVIGGTRTVLTLKEYSLN